MKKGEKRILKSPLSIRTSYSIEVIPEGKTVTIQQIDEKYGNVLIHNVWHNAKKIESMSDPV